MNKETFNELELRFSERIVITLNDDSKIDAINNNEPPYRAPIKMPKRGEHFYITNLRTSEDEVLELSSIRTITRVTE